jgi:hypothetical protein
MGTVSSATNLLGLDLQLDLLWHHSTARQSWSVPLLCPPPIHPPLLPATTQVGDVVDAYLELSSLPVAAAKDQEPPPMPLPQVCHPVRRWKDEQLLLQG